MSLMSNMGQYDENSTGGSEPMPKSDQLLALMDWDLSDTKSGGQGIKATFVVLEGTYKDRQIWPFYTIQTGPNPTEGQLTSVKISGATLKQFVIACGFDGNQDLTEELMNACVGKPFVGKISIEKSKDPQYSDKNKIDKYLSNADYAKQPKASAPAAPPSAPASAPPPAPAPTPEAAPSTPPTPPAAEPAPAAQAKMPWQQ